MKISIHLFISLIIAIALYPIFGWEVLFIIVGGVLIDSDHVLAYLLKYKKLSLRDCYIFFAVSERKNNFKNVSGMLLIFHTIEFLLSVFFLSFFIQIVFVFTIGLAVHYLLDLIWIYSVPKRFTANPSILLWIIRNGIQKV